MKFKIQPHNKVVATVTLKTLGGGDYEIEYMKVDPAYRRQGIASQLLKKCVEWSTKERRLLVAFIEPDGTGMTYQEEVDWLKRHGFKKGSYDYGNYTKREHVYLFDGFNAGKKL